MDYLLFIQIDSLKVSYVRTARSGLSSLQSSLNNSPDSNLGTFAEATNYVFLSISSLLREYWELVSWKQIHWSDVAL